MKVTFEYNARTNKRKVIIPDSDVKERLYYAFSTPNTAKKFVKGPQKHWIQDNIYFITPTGSFNFGLAELIIAWLKEHVTDREIEWEFNNDFKKRFTFEQATSFNNRLAFTPREYQEHCVNLALKHHFRTFVLGTGAGKTFTIASILDNLFEQKKIKRAMILVPDNNLVLQFHDELANQYKMNNKICIFYGKNNTIDEDADIIIANRPLFLSRYLQYKDFWQNKIDCLIIDEAHSLKSANEVSKCIEKMRTEYRFGFTGTLAEEKEDKFKTIGLCRPVRYEKTSKELRDAGFLADVLISRFNLVYSSEKIRQSTYRDEITYLENHEKRNALLAKMACSFSKNTLLLVNHLDHGFMLERMCKTYNRKNKSGKKIYFIRGEIDTEARDEVKKMMEVEDNIICIAITKIFSTGINIKNLHNIILCAGGKSSITVVQSIGRGLRLHPNKTQLNIIDIVDNGHKYAMRHAEKRLKIYQQEKIRTKLYNIEI